MLGELLIHPKTPPLDAFLAAERQEQDERFRGLPSTQRFAISFFRAPPNLFSRLSSESTQIFVWKGVDCGSVNTSWDSLHNVTGADFVVNASYLILHLQLSVASEDSYSVSAQISCPYSQWSASTPQTVMTELSSLGPL